MTTHFKELQLLPELQAAVDQAGFQTPTPIQAQAIPPLLEGKDVIGQAQTGTGKTAAFALPLLQRLSPGQHYPQALVVVPTRELALQVTQVIHAFAAPGGTRVLAIYGGQPYGRQTNRLRRGVSVVVGTPGRLLDLIQQKALDLSRVQMVVLDEADEMLSMGFLEDIEALLAKTPRERQTALFSATVTEQVAHLAKRYLDQPQLIRIEPTQVTAGKIEQRVYRTHTRDKLAVLTRIFEVEEINCALIFVRTRAATGELANELTVRGFPAEALSGDLSQEMREQVMNRFRAGQVKVLVATDVAARGLDINSISHVFNFDLPEDPEIYVHRIGRTGRAGNTGIAISLAAAHESRRLTQIEKFINEKLSRWEVPTEEEILQYRESQLMNMARVWLERGRCRREAELVAELVKEGFDPEEIAAVALKMARAEEKQRPILPLGKQQEPTPSKQRRQNRSRSRRVGNSGSGNLSHEKGMIRLSLSKGRTHGVRPSEVVNTIAFHAGIPGGVIGKILIEDKRTLVDIPEKFAAKVLDYSGSYRIRQYQLSVEPAAG